MKIVIDTNCLIASIPRQNPEYWLYEAFRAEKFADLSISSNANHLVTHDKHFNVLKTLEFPIVSVVNLDEFRILLKW